MSQTKSSDTQPQPKGMEVRIIRGRTCVWCESVKGWIGID